MKGSDDLKETLKVIQAAQSHFEIGFRWYGQGKFKMAAKYFEVATKVDPTEGKYFAYLARSLVGSRVKLHEAEAAAKTAIQLEPEFQDHYVVLGQVYRAAGLPLIAESAFRKALELDPSNAEARAELEALAPKGKGSLIKRLLGL